MITTSARTGGPARAAGNMYCKPRTVPTRVRCYDPDKLVAPLAGAHRVITFDNYPKKLKVAGVNRPPSNRSGVPMPQDCYKRLINPSSGLGHFHLVHIPPQVSAQLLFSIFPDRFEVSQRAETHLEEFLSAECLDWNWICVSSNTAVVERKSLKDDPTLLLKLLFTNISFFLLAGRKFFGCERMFCNHMNGMAVEIVFKKNVVSIDLANRPAAPKYSVLLSLIK